MRTRRRGSDRALVLEKILESGGSKGAAHAAADRVELLACSSSRSSLPILPDFPALSSGRFDGKAPGGTRAVEASVTTLTHEQAAWVREQFSDDVELFEAVCGADGETGKMAVALPECVCSCGPCKRPMGIDDRTEPRPPPVRPVRPLPAAARGVAARSSKIGTRPGR